MNQRERKRQAILNAAICEFQTNGFRGSSMDAISSRAGVSKRTVYNHFESKEALFQAIVMEMFQYAQDDQLFVYDAGQPLATQLKQITRRKIDMMSDAHVQNLVRVIFAEAIHSPHLIAEALEQYQQNEQALDSWIKAAVADGRLKAVDPHYASEQLMGLIKASAFWPQLIMGKAVPDDAQASQIIDDSVAMFLNYYSTAPDHCDQAPGQNDQC